MARDITLVPYTRPEIDIIVVVSADGHFVPAVNSVRGCSRKVVIICTDKPSAVLREASDKTIVINHDTQGAKGSSINSSADGLELLLADIEALIKERGVVFHRKSLIEALSSKCSEVCNKEDVEVLVDKLIEKGVLRFSMLNDSPAIQVNRSALRP